MFHNEPFVGSNPGSKRVFKEKKALTVLKAAKPRLTFLPSIIFIWMNGQQTN